jgi:HAMP domain
MTLQGHYGARATLQGADPKGMILYVAAPIFVKGQVWGVATAYKPQRDVEEFLADTERTLTFVGLSVVIVCTLIGAVLSRWVTAPLAQLTAHAIAISEGDRPAPLRLPGRHLRVLGESLERMRDALEGRKYVETRSKAAPLQTLGDRTLCFFLLKISSSVPCCILLRSGFWRKLALRKIGFSYWRRNRLFAGHFQT